MSARGRPRTPDILTPREWEVLELVRRGCSNREIAEELGISLAGAKFHVSEIISKLNVSSREEAAAWRPRQRWAAVPGVLDGLRIGLPASIAPKLAAFGTAAVVAVAGIGLAAALLVDVSEPDIDGAGTEIVREPCEDRADCRWLAEVEYATVEEAAEFASFIPMMPSHIPERFERHRVLAKKRDFTNPYIPEVHNDWVTVTYRDAEGNRLVISQGFPPRINARYALSGFETERTTLEVNGRQAIFSRGSSVTISRMIDPQSDLGLVLTVFVGRFGSGWGQEGSYFSGSPMEYSVGSDSLDLEELIAVAESVTFPEMLTPLRGATPEPYYD